LARIKFLLLAVHGIRLDTRPKSEFLSTRY
jgi:hypothetical protein